MQVYVLIYALSLLLLYLCAASESRKVGLGSVAVMLLEAACMTSTYIVRNWAGSGIPSWGLRSFIMSASAQ
jgi:hypothetical protein